MESIIFSPKNKKELKLLAQLAKQMKIEAKILSSEDKEDAALLQAMLLGHTGKQGSMEELNILLDT